jgi:hypothetical protein
MGCFEHVLVLPRAARETEHDGIRMDSSLDEFAGTRVRKHIARKASFP